MSARHAILLFVLSTLLAVRATAEVEPIIIGHGKEAVSSDMISALQKVTRSVGGNDTDLWMVRCYGFSSKHEDQLLNVTAYLSPRVHTSRLVRGKSIRCINRAIMDLNMLNSWYKNSQNLPVFGGWCSSGEKPEEYAQVAQPGGAVAKGQPVDPPFLVVGELEGDEIVALADLTRQAAPRHQIYQMHTKDGRLVSVTTEERPGRGLHIEFAKAGSGWKEKARSGWVD
jgi:hypothetical protein